MNKGVYKAALDSDLSCLHKWGQQDLLSIPVHKTVMLYFSKNEQVGASEYYIYFLLQFILTVTTEMRGQNIE